jgi:uncharacterized glyoxalase superfamily protein PhnB
MNTHVSPNLGYADARAVIRFLVDALGFEVAVLYERSSDGSVAHAELRWPGGGSVMLHTAEGKPLADLPASSTAGGYPAYSIHLGTSDPDELFAHAVAAGANVVRKVEDSAVGTRGFIVSDPEGLYWSAGTPLPALTRDGEGHWRPRHD